MRGRPPVEGKPRNVRVVLQALPEEAAAWKREAKRRGTTLSDLIRRLMNAAAKRGAQK
ncbi:MAG: hypothetical protein M5U28_36035 [Sandaracinaceae bacterium]|nr:hypothetical protein [Sandaracinaceae bacterium]